MNPPSGCRFHTRCPFVIDRCRAEMPPLRKWSDDHFTACHRAEELPPPILAVLLYGTKGERFPLLLPDGATEGDEHVGKLFRFNGIINDIERRYRHYRRQKVANTWMDEYLKKVMVEHTCPDCQGAKLKKQRFLVTIDGRNIHELGMLPIDELRRRLRAIAQSRSGFCQ